MSRGICSEQRASAAGWRGMSRSQRLAGELYHVVAAIAAMSVRARGPINNNPPLASMAQSLRFDKWIRTLFAVRRPPIAKVLFMFQYNLKSLLGAMLAVCILTWLFFVLPGEIGFIFLLCGMLIMPSAVLAGILYFRGYPQAFAIGCVPPLLLLGLFILVEGPPRFRFGGGNDLEEKLAISICFLVVMAAGAASAGVRRLAVWAQPETAPSKTFPGLPLDVGRPSEGRRSAAATTTHPLNAEP
jgi:hypothetical protein